MGAAKYADAPALVRKRIEAERAIEKLLNLSGFSQNLQYAVIAQEGRIASLVKLLELMRGEGVEDE